MDQADPDLTADCSKCFGLCCIALRYSREDGFGHDKPAGVPCHFLQTDFRCAIHARLEPLGYEGCAEFTCLGAGQRASQQFAALNWQKDPAIARSLYARFAELLTIQEMKQALKQAKTLKLPNDIENHRLSLIENLEHIAHRQNDGAKDLIKQAQSFVQKLRH